MRFYCVCKMNILFVCSANKLRSRTAEDYFSSKYTKFNFLSAGTNINVCNREGTTPLTEDLLEWADVVYVMENKHKNIIRKNTGSKYINKIIVLRIQDIYEYGEIKLIDILRDRIKLQENIK